MSARITEALNCVNHALMVLPLPSDGPGKRAWASLLEAQKILKSLSTEPGEADGLSVWCGWDQSRPPWGECKHKDAVLEAIFRAPWSVEDAATLIGFIERTWPRAAPLPEDTQHPTNIRALLSLTLEGYAEKTPQGWVITPAGRAALEDKP